MSEWLRRSTRILAFFWIFLGRDVATSAWKEFGRCPVQPAPRARRTVLERRRRRSKLPRDASDRIAAATAYYMSKHKPYEAPSPSELDDDEYATKPPVFGFFSTTGGGASANRRFSTTGI